MTYFEGFVLGLVQGLTEFLPVSSSGHLALSRWLLDYDPPSGLLVEVLMHVGTAASIILVFWSDVVKLLGAGVRLLWPGTWLERPQGAIREAQLILLASVPVVIVGLTCRSWIESAFDDRRLVGALLMVTGAILAATRFVRPGDRAIDGSVALSMGLAQAFAVLPGISRSGSTIAAGLFADGRRPAVGRFAFLMGLPPILGSAALELLDHGSGDAASDLPVGPVILGSAVACVTGIVALLLLLRFVARGRLSVFAPYCVVLGGLALFL